jgi:hypothetical protein
MTHTPHREPGDIAGPDPRHRRPAGLDDDTVTALGKLSEAMETVERARGCLYDFHQLTGHADLILGEAVADLRAAGHHKLADTLNREIVGRNVLAGRWTFQVVEEYDETYYEPFRAAERAARDQLADGRRHLYEAEMKERQRTKGHPRHTAYPAETDGREAH